MKFCPWCDFPMVRLTFIERLIGGSCWVCDRCTSYFKDLFKESK